MEGKKIKVLVVRGYFKNNEILKPFSSQMVTLIEEGKELALGFARIANEDGIARFKVVEEFHGNVDVTPDFSVPVTYFNGIVTENLCDLLFELGDCACILYPQEEEFVVVQDYVVLVPPGTPAQLRA